MRNLDERGRPLHRLIEYRGRFSYGLDSLTIHAWDDRTRLRVGSFCSVAGGAQVILGGEHRLDWATTFPFGHIFREEFPSGDVHGVEGHPATKGDVEISNDVWIGRGCLIVSGSILEDGVVLGAGSILTGRTEPYGVYAGAPARLVRRRFSPDVVEALLDLAWWDWPIEVLDRAVPFLQAPPTDASLETLRRMKPVMHGPVHPR